MAAGLRGGGGLSCCGVEVAAAAGGTATSLSLCPTICRRPTDQFSCATSCRNEFVGETATRQGRRPRGCFCPNCGQLNHKMGASFTTQRRLAACSGFSALAAALQGGTVPVPAACAAAALLLLLHRCIHSRCSKPPPPVPAAAPTLQATTTTWRAGAALPTSATCAGRCCAARVRAAATLGPVAASSTPPTDDQLPQQHNSVYTFLEAFDLIHFPFMCLQSACPQQNLRYRPPGNSLGLKWER